MDKEAAKYIKSDSSTTPVKDEVRLAASILAAVKVIKTTKLKGSITFNIPKNIDTFKLGCELNNNNDLKIGGELSNNGTDVIIIKW